MIERFRILRQTSRWCRFAAATVDVVPATAHAVTVAQRIGGWRRIEAAAGAGHALHRLPAGSGGYRVTVTDVEATNVDTGVGDIHEASARAVWQAIGVNPQPAYLGFSEPDVVAAWLRDRIGLTVVDVTEARHPSAGLVHAWLHFAHRPPSMLRNCGNHLRLSTSDPQVDEAGDLRTGPVTPLNPLAEIIGRPLNNAALIIGTAPEPSCAGFVLQTDDSELVIGTLGGEWILTTDQTHRGSWLR
jgi:hypothetical protein